MQYGLYLHQRLFKNGFLLDVVVVSSMVDMYAKCESIENTSKLFDKMHDMLKGTMEFFTKYLIEIQSHGIQRSQDMHKMSFLRGT